MPETKPLDPKSISFRPITDADLDLLNALYASTRADEMALVDWTEAQKKAFTDQQFQAQHTYYHQVYPAAQFLVVSVEDKPAGRIYLDHRSDEIRLIDITLLPERRNKGLGEYLIRQVMQDAAQNQKAVRIHVEHFNRALHLYERLGFKTLNVVNGVYLFMEWKA